MRRLLAQLPSLASLCRGSIAALFANAAAAAIAASPQNADVQRQLMAREVLAKPKALSALHFEILCRSLASMLEQLAPAFRTGAARADSPRLTGAALLFARFDSILLQPLLWSRFVVWFAASRADVGESFAVSVSMSAPEG